MGGSDSTQIIQHFKEDEAVREDEDEAVKTVREDEDEAVREDEAAAFFLAFFLHFFFSLRVI